MDDMLVMANSKQSLMARAHSSVTVSPGDPGLYYKQQKIYSLTIPKNRISGDDAELNDHGDKTTRRKIKKIR